VSAGRIRRGRAPARAAHSEGRLSAPRPAQSAHRQATHAAALAGAADSGKAARHSKIREVLAAHQVGTQEELGRLLAEEGFRVTQATLSRDLTQLSALRKSGGRGGAFYEVLDRPAAGGLEARLRDVGPLVLSVQDSDALSVVRTQPGAANAVARAIDLAGLPDCLGTIAGDDTIFVSPVRGTSPRKLSLTLKSLLGPQRRDR
jgi:transcriptional regulator of arginine metabolism